MNLKDIAEGGSFDVAAAIRLLALKVGVLNGELPGAMNAATMDAPEAGAMLESGAPARKSKVKKAAETEDEGA